MRDYRLIIFAYLTSSLGNWLYKLTLPLLVLHMTGSALTTGAIYAVEYLPFLLLSLPGGVLADRVNRRLMLVAGDTVSSLLAIVLAIVVTVSVDTVWPIFVVAFLLSCVDPLYHPAFQSFIPDVSPKAKLPQANAWMQAGDNAMGLVGPVIAGVAISVIGYEATIYLDAATFAVSACAILLIRYHSPQVTPVNGSGKRLSGAVKDIREAGEYIFRRDRILFAGALTFTGTNFAIWLVQANFIFYLTTYRHLSPSVIGLVFGAQGIGSVLGSSIAPWIIRRIPPGRVIIFSTAAAGVVTSSLIVFRHVVEITIIWGLLAGFGAINVVSWFSLRQQIVPAYILGRVIAATRMLAFTSIPIAAVVAGALQATLENIYLIIGIAAAFRLGVALIASRSVLYRRPSSARPAPDVPAADLAVPETESGSGQRS
ncbi:MAG TPA: MFS transporter [Jatrophihabitans sp.]|uniref:MFS transporter n=1 Tax=Jatrophihabitans sp. TaxID=1932789 RepID=UPI002F10E1F8